MLIAVRIAEYEWDEMCDLKTLKQWARSGKVKPTDLVKIESEWIEARHATVLKGIFAGSTWDAAETDIWSPKVTLPSSTSSKKPIQKEGEPSSTVPVNSLVSNVQPQRLHTEVSTNQNTRLNPSGIQPLGSDNNAKGQPFTDLTNASERVPTFSRDNAESNLSFADEVALEYQRTKPSSNTPLVNHEQHNSGLNTSVPSNPVELKERGELWNPSVDIKDQLGLLVDEVPRKSRFSWIRLMILVLPGAFIIFFARAFVISEATTVFPEATVTSRQQTTNVLLPNENAPIPNSAQSDALYTLESTLKGMIRSTSQEVSPEQPLSDALRIDLEYVGLEIIRIDAKVLKWKGRMLDKPRAASIELIVSSNGEMENELILATLVIAKYSVLYYLEMPEFTVNIRDGDLLLSKTIQTQDAQFLYLQPGSLKKFIEILSE